jgi:hypothetical protein
MGLTDAIRRFFWTGSGTAEPGPRVATLVREEQALLEQALDGAAYELHDDDVGTCRVVTEWFTLVFGWWWRERWIMVDLLFHPPPDVPFEFDFDIPYGARELLSAIGMPAPPPQPGPKSVALIRDEIALARKAIAQFARDERKLKEAFCYLAGHQQGYNDRVVSFETLPPDPVIVWTEDKLRRRGRPVDRPRAGEGR